MTPINWMPRLDNPNHLDGGDYLIIVHRNHRGRVVHCEVCQGVGRNGRPIVLNSAASISEAKKLAEWRLLGGNHKDLSKGERGNLRELVKNPAILIWHAGLAPHRQRQMAHPNRVITAWKSANRSGTEEALKPTLAKTQQRIILEQDGALAESNKRITALQKQLEDHDWNAAQELDQLTTALVKKLKTRTAREQAALLKQLGESLGFADMLKVLGR